ncbi:MAG TPA: S-layer homology domain-containing protein [Anaerovoracaceae bacterium]|nr:S-layer homology domain-containing protein [Anaerovoracaceae bacterium]
MRGKKLLAFGLTAAMILSSFSVAFSAETVEPGAAAGEAGSGAAEEPASAAAGMFTDTENHWAASAIEKWAGYGALNGSNGKFRPNDYITRAEMATILNNLMGYQAAAENTFSDVPAGAWYEGAVLKANAAGVLTGDGKGLASPTAKITKEQAVLMLARAFEVDPYNGDATEFSDAARISSWAKSLVFGMEANGYISGYNNQFNPQNSITRAEVVTIINNAVKTYYDKAGTYTEDSSGLSIVKAKDVTIKDASISGDLIVADGVADGSFVLDKTTINGDIIFKGECLRPFTLLGSFEDGKMNLVEVAGNAQIYSVTGSDKYAWTWSTDSASSAKDLVGKSFVDLEDTDNDGIADRILAVPRSFSESYWDKNTFWIPGAGENTEPSVDDKTGVSVFGQEYAIPMGERLLTGYGLGDWSGTTDFSNLEDETYWPFIDYYNTTSSDTLTMLTGYKSTLQATGGTCGPASALTVLEWYGKRGDLNEEDVSGLREPQPSWGGFSSLEAMTGIFENLGDLGVTKEWDIYSSYDDPKKLFDSEWVRSTLAAGHPILVGWNSFGGHWQVIIGYDTMGTEGTNDDVLILMDPYDTTDHSNNGYNIQSYERLAWGAGFEDVNADPDEEFTGTSFLVAIPEGWNYDGAVKGAGIPKDTTNTADFTDARKIPYGDTAADITAYYPETEYRGNDGAGLAGAATEGYERSGDFDNSPYYKSFDFYNYGMKGSDSLVMLSEFRTVQQSTEWTCGPASALMVLDWFDKSNGLTDIDLAQMRQEGKEGATTINGMEEIFGALNEDGGNWAWFTTRDLAYDEDLEAHSIGGHYLEWGADDDGLIPYLISAGIPVMVGWDEWGGHWQVVVGYDDMGTYGTQDDVLILADPYDTTDHNQDGYVLESFERLVYGWDAAFDEDYALVVAFPEKGNEGVIEALGLEKPYFSAK